MSNTEQAVPLPNYMHIAIDTDTDRVTVRKANVTSPYFECPGLNHTQEQYAVTTPMYEDWSGTNLDKLSPKLPNTVKLLAIAQQGHSRAPGNLMVTLPQGKNHVLAITTSSASAFRLEGAQNPICFGGLEVISNYTGRARTKLSLGGLSVQGELRVVTALGGIEVADVDCASAVLKATHGTVKVANLRADAWSIADRHMSMQGSGVLERLGPLAVPKLRGWL